MKYPTLFTSLSLSLLLSACSSNPVTVSMSTTRFDNPEVSSEPLKVNLAVGHGGRTTLAIEDNLSHYDGTEVYGFASGNITATKGLEISVRNDEDSATHIGLKYQFYGAHTEQSSKGNISQAFTLGYERNTTGEQYSTYNDNWSCDEFSCDSTTNTSVWEHDTNIYDIAWVVGYKFAARDIIYGGPFYQWGQLSGYKASSNAPTEELKSKGYMVGANIAIEHRFSFGMGLAGEIVYSNLDWGNYNQSDTAFNFKIDYQF
ncbi:hypothetical protein CXF85_17800 [Colwellia sp. 75C3]|uniref:hypothetical protein n=1 Tax=Colwellia sp. 75C3 TaxID=888425 RepID=UPI000C347514|nr:hypothetical protein [Colwellia sp. 75C3]PKG81331.1 hypothetical protein CXF85_17800 [Colwellia sp. 75C3]